MQIILDNMDGIVYADVVLSQADLDKLNEEYYISSDGFTAVKGFKLSVMVRTEFEYEAC